MTKNPIINALSALVYILMIVFVMNTITATMGDKPDSLFAPVVFLSIFSLSTAVMAFIFAYQPVQLLIDGKKKAGLRLAVQTIAVFAALTATCLFLLFVGLL